MKLALVAVIFLAIFQNSAGQGDASEDDNPDELEDNYDDQINLVSTETWEENAEEILPDESNSKGNESFEGSNATTLRQASPRKSESQTKGPQALDPDECGDPPFVKNALIFEGEQNRYEVGARVTYACEFGYITDGSVHFSECLLSDVTQTLYWTDAEIRCSPRSCGDPGYVSHAHKVGSVFTFPNKVTFECDDGYALRGYGTRYCQTSGTWSGNLPTCEPIFCDPPQNPENGRVSYSSLGFESELRYECDPGYILKNDQGRICSANGTWTGSVPVCLEAQCDPPVAPEHGTVQVIGDKSSVGSRVLYTCGEGRVLAGSASSKCLDIGEWTFPTPKCLEPCSVPKLQHGKIGRYVGYRRKRFEELKENSKIEDGEELFFRCEPNYEPFGNPESEIKVTCSQGQWEAVPDCKPAQCRSPPPPTLNGRLARANRTHGGGVVYLCGQYAKKVKYGNVTCVFGSWKGVTPVCKDLRCSVGDLVFPGLIKGKKTHYLPGHLFTVNCESGFNLTKENNQLKCVDGAWEGHLPPCITAPCNPEDLVELEGIVADGEKAVLHGEQLKVKCREGNSPSGQLAHCSRGQWTVTGKLCQESKCFLHTIDNGGFSQRVEKKQLTWALTYDRWFEYPRLPLDGIRSPGSWVFVSCDGGYNFQGTRGKHVLVKCSKGKWTPDPVCLITGTPYIKESNVFLEMDEKSNTRRITHPNRIAPTTKQPILLTTQNWIVAPEAEHVENLNPNPYPSCACTFRSVDDNLVAYVGEEKLEYGSRVKNNDKIKFHCLHFGYSRINGLSEIKCENCRSWHSSEFPECAAPRLGDTILQFEGDYIILPGGIVGVFKGKQLTVRCASNGIADFPNWSSNVHKQLLYTNVLNREGHYVSTVIISKASNEHNGFYQCQMKRYRPSVFDIQVISPPSVNCSKFDDRDFIIHYDKEQSPNSTAIFSCRDNRQKLDGPNIITCLSNGKWSGNPPKCITTCPKINETEGMAVSYTKNLEQDSIAAFHCLEPQIRSGVSRATCKANGEWSDPPATCTLPSCNLDQLFEVVPENVVPVMDGIQSDTLPFNFSLHLTCDNNMMLSGVDVAKCGQNGSWQISRVQCVSGCGLPKSENSELIIEPSKSFYRFGESVVLSCSPGYVLTPEVFRLMCLGTSWSESVPRCRKE